MNFKKIIIWVRMLGAVLKNDYHVSVAFIDKEGYVSCECYAKGRLTTEDVAEILSNVANRIMEEELP